MVLELELVGVKKLIVDLLKFGIIFELRIIFEILLSFYYILFLVLLFSCVFMI